MRVAIVFFVCLFSFLQCGANPTAKAATHANNRYHFTHNLEKKHSGKFTNTNTGGTLVDDTDFDVIEESHFSDNLTDSVSKFHTGKSYLPENWNSNRVSILTLNYNCAGITLFLPFSSHSPIYITQRVLRI